MTRRSVIAGALATSACLSIPARAGVDNGGEASTSCLPPVLYASDPSEAAIAGLRDEIARERSFQGAYYSGAERFLGQLAIAAVRLCEALDIRAGQRPEILLAASRAWRTVDRRFSDRGAEVVLLSKDDTLAMTDQPSESMLFAVLAHEFGHVYQFMRSSRADGRSLQAIGGLSRPLRELELHADFLAGYGLARSERSYGRPDDLLRRFSDTIFRLGDFHFAPCLHHGTPAERYTMMMKGYIEAQRTDATGVDEASDVALALLRNDLRGLDDHAQASAGPACR